MVAVVHMQFVIKLMVKYHVYVNLTMKEMVFSADQSTDVNIKMVAVILVPCVQWLDRYGISLSFY